MAQRYFIVMEQFKRKHQNNENTFPVYLQGTLIKSTFAYCLSNNKNL